MFSEVKTSATNEQKGKGAIIQPKLKVNVPGDSYEREADAMAEKIVQNPIHQLGMSGTPFTSVSSNYIQRKCDKCKEDETKKRNGILMRKADNSGGLQPSSGFESTLSASKGAGSPLPAHAKTYMESAFSADFSKVRVHTGSAAIEMNKDVNAKAFTHGSDIYFNNGQYNTDTNTGTKLLVHELTHVVQQNNNTELNRSIQRQPDKPLPDDPPKSMYSAQYIVSSYYPLLLPLLNINQMSLIQAHLDYRYNIKKHNKDEDAMKARFQKRMKKLGLKYVEDPNPRFDTPGGYYSEEQNYAVSTYFRRIEEFEERSPDFPSDTDIYVDTTPLIDEKILDQQPWNIQAEQEFRERWVANLTGKQCMYRIALDGLSIDQILRGPVWEERWLQTENGLITFNSLFNIPEARQDYYYSVQNSPLITSVRENMRQIKSLYSNTENMYDLEVARKKEFPGVSRVAEFLGSELDGEALKQFIPKGKNIDNISFVEMLVVIRTLTKEQMDLVTRTLPSRAKWDEAVGFYERVKEAVEDGKFEMVAMFMPVLAARLEYILRKTLMYQARTNEGAATAITILETVKQGCKLTLTILGGVAGKASGLIGVSLGSAEGAAVATMTQMAAEQLYEGKLEVGSILLAGGKEGFITFINSLVSGALAQKFQALFNLKLSTSIPNDALRNFAANRVADITSGVLIKPVEIAVNGIIEGEWPDSMDEFLGMIADNAVDQFKYGTLFDFVGMAVVKLKGKKPGTQTDIDEPAFKSSIPEGLMAPEVATPTGHSVKVTNAGHIAVCSSPCSRLRDRFSHIIGKNKALDDQLILLEKKAASATTETSRIGRIKIAHEVSLEAAVLHDKYMAEDLLLATHIDSQIDIRYKGSVKGEVVIVWESELDDFVMQNEPKIGDPPPGLRTAEDLAAWELYTLYFEDRVRRMRQDIATTQATKRNPPRDFDSFREAYLEDPKMMQLLRGRLAESGTANAIEQLVYGKVGRGMGLSSERSPGVGEVKYADFMWKNYNGSYTTVSNKSRDFYAMGPIATKRTVRADVKEALEKYGGDKYVRRPGLDQTGQKVTISEVVLNYDPSATLLTDDMAAEIYAYAKEYKGDAIEITFVDYMAAEKQKAIDDLIALSKR